MPLHLYWIGFWTCGHPRILHKPSAPVGGIGRPGGGQKQTASALQIMARLVLISDKPLVESALARANRFRGARVGTTLVDLLKDERGELQMVLAPRLLPLDAAQQHVRARRV